MRQIRELWLCEGQRHFAIPPNSDIRIILQELPALRVLRLPARYVSSLCELVRSPTNPDLCPALRVLHIGFQHTDAAEFKINLLKNVESSWRQSPRGARAQLEYVTIDSLLRGLPPGDDEYTTDSRGLPPSLEIKEFHAEQAPRIELPSALLPHNSDFDF